MDWSGEVATAHANLYYDSIARLQEITQGNV